MNLHISYKAEKTPDLEREFQTHIHKLERRLQVFRPELVHLRASIENANPRQGTVVSLDLRLPSGDIATKESGSPASAAIKVAFSELTKQLGRHTEQLRGQRHRHRAKEAATVPFESTVASVQVPKVSNGDVNTWIDANLPRLERFIARELRHRENNGTLRAGQVSREEVLDEAIATALGNGGEKPEVVSLERWLYRLSLRAIDKLGRDGEPGQMVHLEESVRKQNVRASDEPQLQYHQPDEMMTGEDVIADRGAPTPEEVFYSEEMVAMVETALQGVKPEEREAFILNGIEGFTIKEIATITERSPKMVEANLETALAHLRRRLPSSTPLRDRLLHPKSA